MSTVTNNLIDEGAAFTAATVDDAFNGLSTGYNAVDNDDFADNALGYEVAAPVVVAALTTKVFQANKGAGTTAVASAYPGYGVVTGWTQVVMSASNAVLTAVTPFEVGPTSPEKIIGVLVGATWAATAASDGRFAIGVKHSGTGGAVHAIPETDFPATVRFSAADSNYSVEFMIDENVVPAGQTLEEIWVLACGPSLTINHGQLWGLPLHGG